MNWIKIIICMFYIIYVTFPSSITTFWSGYHPGGQF